MVPQPAAPEPLYIMVNGHRLDAPKPQATVSVPGAWTRGWFTVKRHQNESLGELKGRCEDLRAAEQDRQDKAARSAARGKQPLAGADGRVMRKRNGKRQHSKARSVRHLMRSVGHHDAHPTLVVVARREHTPRESAPRIRGGGDSCALVAVAD